MKKRRHPGGVFFFVMATRKMHALVQVHLTTANQSEIRRAYLVSIYEKCIRLL